MNLFTYGTLTDPDFVARLLGHPVQMTDAMARGYVRLQPNFYMIFEHEGSSTKGKLIADLKEEDIAIIDRYEGNGFGYYDRRTIWIEADGVECHLHGDPRTAEAYVGGPHMRWFYENWLNSHN